MNKFQIRLEQTQELTRKVYKFSFSIVEDLEFEFQAGQFISIVVAENVKRYYSIASVPGEKFLELIVGTSPGGPGSIFFEKIKVGDVVDVLGPLGKFVYQSSGAALFIATGTGIAPFASIIKDELKKGNQKKIELLFGVRHQQDIFLKDELDELEGKYPNFTYNLTLSRPDESWKGKEGRVTAHDGIILHSIDRDFYICGLKEMIEDVKAMLIGAGVDEKRIFVEMY